MKSVAYFQQQEQRPRQRTGDNIEATGELPKLIQSIYAHS